MRYLILVSFLVLSNLASAQTRDTVTILHINDSHSMLAPFGPRDQQLQGTQGGIARAASVIGMSRMTDPNVLFLHNGDFMIGDLFFNKFFGVAELRILQALGLDALNVSNHEFDLTPAVLAQALDSGFVGGNVPILTSNLIIPEGMFPSISSRLQPYLIRQYGASKLGVFAITTPATNLLSQPAPIFIDTNIIPLVIQHVQALKSQGCDAIVFMSGLGVTIDKQIAAGIPGIDLIVGGDDHYLIDPAIEIVNPSGEKTYIVQANAFYSHVGRVQLEISDGKTRLLNYRAIKLDQSIPQEPNTRAAVALLLAEIEATYGQMYSQQIATATSDFMEFEMDRVAIGNHDTPVGNLITDIYRNAFGTDIAIHAGGSTAQGLYKGPIVAADLYRMISYGFNTDNTLGYHMATFEITGAALAMGLELGLAAVEEDDEFMSQTSGMRYSYDPMRPPYARLVEVMIGGAPLDLNRTYTLTSNEFAPMILGAIGIPISNVRVYGGDTTEFGTITQAVMQMQTLTPVIEGRIRAVATNAVASENRIRTSVKAFPNPCSNLTELRFELDHESRVDITLMDVTGKVVRSMTAQCQSGTNVVQLETQELPSGHYLCMIESPTSKQTTLISVRR